MTQEEKARRYDEALERAKDFIEKQNPPAFDKDLIGTIFPELAKSEDERIRKSLINFFDNANKCGENPMYEYRIYPEEILAWLEKQGEKKHVHQNTWKPSDEQIKVLKEACDEHWEQDGLDPLYTLWEQLKKLKGE